MWRLVMISGSVFLAAACAETRWVHPSVGPDQAAADLDACDRTARIEAQQQVLFESLARPRVFPGGAIGYPQAGNSFRERNSEWFWTQQFRDRCMQAKGYRLTRVE